MLYFKEVESVKHSLLAFKLHGLLWSQGVWVDAMHHVSSRWEEQKLVREEADPAKGVSHVVRIVQVNFALDT